MNRYFPLLLFLVLNFGGLWLGAYFMGDGVTSDWYTEINKAPWTPPGWVFGAAWTVIMICFTFFLFYLFRHVNKNRGFILLFVLSWILNVAWNPLFFNFHQTILGLIVIFSLAVVIAIFLIRSIRFLGWKALLILPYFIWICIATSLNAYIVLNN